MNVGRNGAEKCLIIGDPNRHQMMEKHMINIYIYTHIYHIYIYIYHIYIHHIYIPYIYTIYIYTIYIYTIYIYMCVPFTYIYVCYQFVLSSMFRAMTLHWKPLPTLAVITRIIISSWFGFPISLQLIIILPMKKGPFKHWTSNMSLCILPSV